jgi:cytochrome d ubiquinol oxidase subunit II
MSIPFDLNTIWFVLVGILFTGYAMLDGFDLGIGALHLFTKKDEERRMMLNAIGPVWDGNEVWLVVGGGALFAAFPNCYATVFPGFYLAFVLPLFALIFRAVAIEFRRQTTHVLVAANVGHRFCRRQCFIRAAHRGRDGQYRPGYPD